MNNRNGHDYVQTVRQPVQIPPEIVAQLPAMIVQQQQQQLLELAKTLKPSDAKMLTQQTEVLAANILAQLGEIVGPCEGEIYSNLTITFEDEGD